MTTSKTPTKATPPSDEVVTESAKRSGADAQAKKVFAQANARKPKRPSPVRPVDYVSKPKDMESLPPRDVKTYTPGALAMKCPRCSAPKNAPCVQHGPKRSVVCYCHGKRKAAATKK